jgi:hypothetical protein
METRAWSLRHDRGKSGGFAGLVLLGLAGLAGGCSPASRSWLNPYDPQTTEKLVYEDLQTGVYAQLRSDQATTPQAPSPALLSASGDATVYKISVELNMGFLSTLGNVNIERVLLGVKVLSVPVGNPDGFLTAFKPDPAAPWPSLATQCFNLQPVILSTLPNSTNFNWKLGEYQDLVFGGSALNIFNGVGRFVIQANGPGNIMGGYMTVSDTFRVRVYYKPKI